MAEDKLLSMSLDDIIRMKKASGRGSNSRSSSQTRTKMGTRGKANFSPQRRYPIGVASSSNLRRGGFKTQIYNRYNRGTFRRRGFPAGVRNRPLRIDNGLLQREYSIALARNRLQMAKRFLNNKRLMGLGVRRNMGGFGNLSNRRMQLRGVNRGIKRGRSGFQMLSNSVGSFRSNHMFRMNQFMSKLNRSQSAAFRNSVPRAPSLTVSIENEFASSASTSGLRGGRRGMRKRGGISRMRNMPTMQLQNDMYHHTIPNAMPFHTAALDPDIQRMIADIQGKTNRGTFPARRSGIGRLQRGLGRGHIAAARLSDEEACGLSFGLPMATACTLNERFGGRM